MKTPPNAFIVPIIIIEFYALFSLRETRIHHATYNENSRSSLSFCFDTSTRIDKKKIYCGSMRGTGMFDPTRIQSYTNRKLKQIYLIVTLRKILAVQMWTQQDIWWNHKRTQGGGPTKYRRFYFEKIHWFWNLPILEMAGVIKTPIYCFILNVSAS